jgi:dolichol-phosphate mannosyltransferase
MSTYLNVIIPAHNEEGNLFSCATVLIKELKKTNVSFKVIIVNDCSTDGTNEEINLLVRKYGSLIIPVLRKKNNGFGNAVRAGLEKLDSKYFSLVMADASDDPKDLVRMIRLSKSNYDVVFTNRFIKNSVSNYPKLKLFVNRLGNNLISFLFFTRFNDLTNAFQLIKTDLIKNYNFKAEGFELTLEISLLALINGNKFRQTHVRWIGREVGISKFKLVSLMSKYLFVIFKFLPYRLRLVKFK